MPKEDNHNKLICCAGGKSAGHILPCLALAKKAAADRVLFFSSNSQLDMKILPGHTLVTWHVPLSLAWVSYTCPLGIAKLFWSFCIASYHLLKYRPTQVITTGGLSAIPTCCAAFALRIPIMLHELNATPGKASRFLAPLATRITVCFPNTVKKFPKHKTCIGNYPLRTHFTSTQSTARKLLGIPSNTKAICVVGGSQGSQFINAIIRTLFDKNKLPIKKLHIMHQTGADAADKQREWYKQRNINHTVFSYTDQLHTYLTAADLIICRSGAGSLFECAALDKSFITIPLENVGANHQVDNAYAMAHMYPDRCCVLRQKQLLDNSNLLANTIQHRLSKHRHIKTSPPPFTQVP